ncbi:MAG: hypothetical protein R2769_07265 [Saprospiraceae bacterium]
MAVWAFALGYVISSMIQALVTEKRMQETMGSDEKKAFYWVPFSDSSLVPASQLRL